MEVLVTGSFKINYSSHNQPVIRHFFFRSSITPARNKMREKGGDGARRTSWWLSNPNKTRNVDEAQAIYQEWLLRKNTVFFDK